MPSATDSLITCPHCGQSFRLDEAVLRQHREAIENELREKAAAQQTVFAAREQALTIQAAQLEQRQQSVAAEVQRQVEAGRQKLKDTAAREAREQLGVELADLKARADQQKTQLDATRAQELEFRKQARALEEQKQTFELELTRKLDAERQKLVEQARTNAAEEQHLRLAEKEKIIGDMQAQIATLKQKAEQGSMQLQGDVLEIDLEQRIAAAFPSDLVEAVSTGVRGADLHHTVRTSGAQVCGVLVWEAKRTKNWSRDWPAKLKEDQRNAKADLAVLVTQALPDGIRGFGLADGVWVCDYASALPLAQVLRQWLVGLAVARQAETGRMEKTAQLYSYLTGPEFRQQVEGVVEAFKAMREDLEAEKRALQKHWSRREKELDRAIGCTAALYGSVQGIAGSTALPDIAPLALEDAS